LSRLKKVNLVPVHFDLEKELFNAEFDLVITQMVLHHVKDVNGILHKFNMMLKPGGVLAIADLFPEDGSFHEEGFNGHKGFNPVKMACELSSLGFRNINHTTCFIIKRTLENGTIKEFPVFLITACK
jgi:tRNA (cmo5U34)-methyltransferase